MYKGKKVIHIVARDVNCGIGKDNKLLWNIPEDMKFFRDKTLGEVCLVGRKTLESFPSPLKRRAVVNVTASGGDIWSFLSEAYELSEILKTDKIYIIGGQKLYESTFDIGIVDELLVTEVLKDCEADRFYNIPDTLRLFEIQPPMTSITGVDFRFTRYLRKEDLPF